jgi:hypothetical protein
MTLLRVFVGSALMHFARGALQLSKGVSYLKRASKINLAVTKDIA